MNAQIAAALRLLPNTLAQHVVLSAAALALGAAISLPLALLAARRPRLRWPLVAAASLIQTIPSLALLALFYPLLLSLSTLTQRVGLTIPALGFAPSLIALTLYAMLPILRNGVAGLNGVDPALIEAADGVGMSARQRLLWVEIPLSVPVVMGGVRTAAVWTVGAATLATPVGQTTLGDYIFAGLQTENWVFVLFGCAAAAALAMLVDGLLALVEQGAMRRDGRRVLLGLGLLAGGALAAAASLVTTAKPIVVGAKNFSEQFILAELMASRLDAQGVATKLREGLGSAIAFRALAAGDVDVMVDYSGTLWTNTLGRADTLPREQMIAEITRVLREKYGVAVLGALGFENAYALAMRRSRAQELGVASVAELARLAPTLSLGADIEFLQRPEWTSLRDAYGLRFARERSFNPTFMYRALVDGDVDVISAFSSDGRIAADDLVTLAGPEGRPPRLRRAAAARAWTRAGRQIARGAQPPRRGDRRHGDAARQSRSRSRRRQAYARASGGRSRGRGRSRRLGQVAAWLRRTESPAPPSAPLANADLRAIR